MTRWIVVFGDVRIQLLCEATRKALTVAIKHITVCADAQLVVIHFILTPKFSKRPLFYIFFLSEIGTAPLLRPCRFHLSSVHSVHLLVASTSSAQSHAPVFPPHSSEYLNRSHSLARCQIVLRSSTADFPLFSLGLISPLCPCLTWIISPCPGCSPGLFSLTTSLTGGSATCFVCLEMNKDRVELLPLLLCRTASKMENLHMIGLCIGSLALPNQRM